jgi:hypothetical protein
MPNLTFPKSALEPRPNLPAGMIQVMFKGFKQKLSAKKPDKEQTVNMNPELVVVNDSRTLPDGKSLNGQKVFDSLNLSFMPRVQDFFHCFGVEMVENGDNVDFPGFFDGDTTQTDCAKWGAYHGGGLNEIGTIELVETQANKKDPATGQYVPDPTKTRTEIKRYICRVPGCQVQHMENLIRS